MKKMELPKSPRDQVRELIEQLDKQIREMKSFDGNPTCRYSKQDISFRAGTLHGVKTVSDIYEQQMMPEPKHFAAELAVLINAADASKVINRMLDRYVTLQEVEDLIYKVLRATSPANAEIFYEEVCNLTGRKQ